MEKKKRRVGIWDLKLMFESSIIIFVIVGTLATTTVYYINMGEHDTSYPASHGDYVDDSFEGCDLFSGKWVMDNESSYYPLYKEDECPYIPGEFSCGRYGRTDFKYQRWRWQPHGCNLPRFNAKDALDRLRGKRVIFVGDSVNRNQWLSMVCMLQSVIPLGLKKMEKVANNSLFTFKAFEYDVSIDFYWAPFLVESNADHPSKHKRKDTEINIQTIEKHAKRWVNADILVFNSYLWWGAPTIKIMDGSLADSKKYNVVSNHDGYKMVLDKWSKWLTTHINQRTQLYFMSMTATHRRGLDWGMQGSGNCLNETEPVMKDVFWESGSDMEMMKILESSLDELKGRGVNVKLVNITQLTQYRKDGHPSIHRLFYSTLKAKQLSNPMGYADCTHWCLPGVPDTWNELLLAYILQRLK